MLGVLLTCANRKKSKKPETIRTLRELWQCSVQTYNNNRLIVTHEVEYTFSQCAQVVEKISARLNSSCKKGDCLCVYSTLHLESILTFWACMSAGIIFVPLDPNGAVPSTARILDQVAVKLLFCDYEHHCAINNQFNVPQIVFDEEQEHQLLSRADQHFSAWLEDVSSETVSEPKVSPDTTAVILFTSGTNNVPKGVMLSQNALCESGRLFANSYSWKHPDLLFCPGEMHTMSGLRNPCITSLHSGSAFLLTSRAARSDVFSIIANINNYECTYLNAAPILIRQLLQFSDRIPHHILQNLKAILTTGSNVTEDLVREFFRIYGVPIFNYYGLTETCGFCVAVLPELFENSPGSIGLPIGCQIEIVDENDIIVKPGQVGELKICSPNLMQGYYKTRQLTSKVLKNGWFYTGDLARQREDGMLELVGRKSDIIKNAYTELIHPAEIETVLERHPKVAEAGVCGFYSSLGDERLVAFIVTHATQHTRSSLFEELKKLVYEDLSPHKVPSLFYFRESLPYNTNGKLIRSELVKGMQICK